MQAREADATPAPFSRRRVLPWSEREGQLATNLPLPDARPPAPADKLRERALRSDRTPAGEIRIRTARSAPSHRLIRTSGCRSMADRTADWRKRRTHPRLAHPAESERLCGRRRWDSARTGPAGFPEPD